MHRVFVIEFVKIHIDLVDRPNDSHSCDLDRYNKHLVSIYVYREHVSQDRWDIYSSSESTRIQSCPS